MSKLTLETLNTDRLKKSVSLDIYAHGQALHQSGIVQLIDLSDAQAHCIVQDKHPYRVEIKVIRNFLYLKCDCRHAYRGLICEHEIAACFSVRDRLLQRAPPSWRNQVKKLVDSPVKKAGRTNPNRYFLFFSLNEAVSPAYSYWKISPYQLPLGVFFKETGISHDKLDQADLINHIERRPELKRQLRSPYNYLNPEGCLNCGSESVILANLIIDRSRQYALLSGVFPLDNFLTLLSRTPSPIFYGSSDQPLQKEMIIMTDPGELRLRLNRQTGGLHLEAIIVSGAQSLPLSRQNHADENRIIVSSPPWVMVDKYLLRLNEQTQLDLFNAFLENPDIQIPESDEPGFLKKFLMPLAHKIPLEGDALKWEETNVEPSRRLYLSESGQELRAELRFGYGDVEVSYDPQLPSESLQHLPDSWTLLKIIRRPESELHTYNELSSATYGMKRAPSVDQPGTFFLRARIHPLDFLLRHVPLLTKDGFEIFGEEKIKSARVNRNSPHISFSISSGIDWFDVKTVVRYGDLDVSFKDVRRAVQKQQRYIKLADGTIGEIPQDWIDRFRHLFSFGEESPDGLRVSRHHISLIDQALQDIDQVEIDPDFQQQKQRLLNFTGLQSTRLPEGFTGDLRPYQKAGYDWLHFLHEYRFGGCLADDMGLGKTVQVLVFFQSLSEGITSSSSPLIGESSHSERRNGPGANLIVVPRSLLVNWEREAARFTPGLRVLEYFDSNRIKDPAAFDEHDLVITTYGVMLRDIAELRKYLFHYVLLDESQVIKNPLAQTARAARLLHAEHHLVLTGTPVENSTVELWSQFAFLNPGLLGNLEYFKKEFHLPIEKKSDNDSADLLRKLIFPFVLRRTKDQVAPELPPRTERILYCDMEPAQRKFYNRTRDYYRGIVMGMLERQESSDIRFKMLEGLLRLRQISNHPHLVDQNYRGESGKFELLIENLMTIKAEGHKVLVFSQFVQMLKLVREPLDGLEIPYLYLDGRTRNRMELVDNFQSNLDIPFFLISLKAGGQGLNLTAADYVIHIDPWWNPAVEAQASDRTHRIGQDKPVFIYKLITRDSVEEKILILQERKKNLVDQIITTESGFFKSLTEEDIKSLFN